MRLPTFCRNQLALHEEEDDNNNPEWFYTLLDEKGHCHVAANKGNDFLGRSYMHQATILQTVTGLDYECLESCCSSLNLILMLHFWSVCG
jgi:hypothetical protein